MEDIELDLDAINALAPEEKAERLLEIAQQATAKVREKEEYVKKLESAQENGVQKLLDDKKYQDLMRTESKNLGNDADYIVELVNRDARLAQQVLDEYFGGLTIAEALAQAKPEKIKEYNAKANEKKVEETVKDLLSKKEVENTTKTFLSRAKLSDEEQQSFDKEFAELTDGKKLNETNIEKYLRLALREALPDVDVKKIERDAIDMAGSNGMATNKSGGQQHNARSSNIAYLKKMGIL